MEGFKYETHLHTRETSSCAKVSAKEIPHLYKEAGYDGIVVTDHYSPSFFEPRRAIDWERCVKQYLEGYYIAANEGVKIGMPVLLGMEITFEESYNDYLVYGIDERFLYRNPRLHKKTLKEFRKIADKYGLFVAQAHPFRPYMKEVKPKFLDGMEVFNGNPRHDSHNDLAMEYAKKKKLQALSGSDFHQLEDLARGGIAIDEFVTSSEELAEYLHHASNPVSLIRSEL